MLKPTLVYCKNRKQSSMQLTKINVAKVVPLEGREGTILLHLPNGSILTLGCPTNTKCYQLPDRKCKRHLNSFTDSYRELYVQVQG